MMDKKKILALLLQCRGGHNKVLICGNGGSAANSQHLAGDLIARGVRAIALTVDTSVCTAIANDFGYRYIFSRQINVLGDPGDILIVFSSSGKSKNCLEAMKQAKKQKMVVVDMPRIGKTTQEREENQLKLAHFVYLSLPR